MRNQQESQIAELEQITFEMYERIEDGVVSLSHEELLALVEMEKDKYRKSRGMKNKWKSRRKHNSGGKKASYERKPVQLNASVRGVIVEHGGHRYLHDSINQDTYLIGNNGQLYLMNTDGSISQFPYIDDTTEIFQRPLKTPETDTGKPLIRDMKSLYSVMLTMIENFQKHGETKVNQHSFDYTEAMKPFKRDLGHIDTILEIYMNPIESAIEHAEEYNPDKTNPIIRNGNGSNNSKRYFNQISKSFPSTGNGNKSGKRYASLTTPGFR